MPSTPDWLGLYLQEDLGPGDLTAAALPAGEQGSARIVARERLLVAGAAHAAEVFRRLGATATPCATEGAWASPGAPLLEVRGPAQALLAGERLALNLLARMAGIASLTRELADALAKAGARAQVAATRKTTPGFRAFEKEAVRVGGGDPHRMGLWDAAMVKDNHIAACAGDVDAAVRRVVAAARGRTVTCEVESHEDARAAAAAGADWLLIDNQAGAVGEAWARAVRAEFPHIKVEASGGIRPDNLLEYGWADRVSLGWLTQKAPAKDLSMEWDA
ncbi:MAG TPA: carboxylating nicotinate-nucleotide diphosphorylase [Candidatus Thermoplasmatota archaeon]|nr:carboxylating nicotinate-nucleotide diphosphorylase [Candidatus Thermoplasmatota archaeon]